MAENVPANGAQRLSTSEEILRAEDDSLCNKHIVVRVRGVRKACALDTDGPELQYGLDLSCSRDFSSVL